MLVRQQLPRLSSRPPVSGAHFCRPVANSFILSADREAYMIPGHVWLAVSDQGFLARVSRRQPVSESYPKPIFLTL
jgi:hypothetical protein